MKEDSAEQHTQNAAQLEVDAALHARHAAEHDVEAATAANLASSTRGRPSGRWS